MNESITHILAKPWVVPAVVGGAALGIGFTGGYFLGKKRGVDALLEDVYTNWVLPAKEVLDKEYVMVEDIWEEPLDNVDENTVETRESFSEYQQLVTDYTNPPQEEGEMDPEDIPSEAVVHNVFEGRSEDWDYDKEIAKREELVDEPYVIHVDEFIRNDLGFRQETLTYYAGDDTLAAEDERAVYNYRKLTGELLFGHGSNDSNAVYIRNPGVRIEWEILSHQGSYTSEVEGLEISEELEEADLKHSATRKFRQGD